MSNDGPILAAELLINLLNLAPNAYHLRKWFFLKFTFKTPVAAIPTKIYNENLHWNGVQILPSSFPSEKKRTAKNYDFVSHTFSIISKLHSSKGVYFYDHFLSFFCDFQLEARVTAALLLINTKKKNNSSSKYGCCRCPCKLNCWERCGIKKRTLSLCLTWSIMASSLGIYNIALVYPPTVLPRIMKSKTKSTTWRTKII